MKKKMQNKSVGNGTLSTHSSETFSIKVFTNNGEETIEAKVVDTKVMPGFVRIEDVKTKKTYTVHRQRIPHHGKKDKITGPLRKADA